MKAKQFLTDFLRGTGCAAGTMLLTAVAFITGYESALMLFLSAAAILYLCILLLRTPDKSSRRIRTATAFLMYPPVLGLTYLLTQISPFHGMSNVTFEDLCFLLVIALPGSVLLMAVAALYAARQKTHPVIPLILMYAAYAMFQADAFRLAAMETLSRDSLDLLEYTKYARTGFFEICLLAVIHTAMIIQLNRRIRDGSAVHPKLLKALAAALCLYTVFIAVTALAQMTVYIKVRGLSERRLYASWFVIMLGAAFLVLLIRQFVRKIPAAAIPAVSLAVLAGLTIHAQPAKQIAEYNIERYESGALDEIDVKMLCGLSDEAYTVMAQHEDTLKRAGQWETYQYYTDTRRMNGKV